MPMEQPQQETPSPRKPLEIPEALEGTPYAHTLTTDERVRSPHWLRGYLKEASQTTNKDHAKALKEMLEKVPQ